MTITTNMSCAGYEPGCKVVVRLPPPEDGMMSQDEISRVLFLGGQGPWIFVDSEFPFIMLDGPSSDGEPDGVRRIREHYTYVERDYDDAQEARKRRFMVLWDNFGGDIELIDPEEPMQRFACVQKDAQGSACYMFGDTLQEAVSDAGGNMLDGDHVPEGAYDLDTGNKINLQISNPVVTAAEEQGVTVNELDADEVAEAKAWVEREFNVVAVEFAVSITVPPDRGDEMAGLLDSVCGASWVEHATVRKADISQANPERAAARAAAAETAGNIANAAGEDGA